MLRRQVQIHEAKLANCPQKSCFSFNRKLWAVSLVALAGCSSGSAIHESLSGPTVSSEERRSATFHRPWVIPSPRPADESLGSSCFIDSKLKLIFAVAGDLWLHDLEDSKATAQKILSLPTGAQHPSLGCDAVNRVVYYSYGLGGKNFELASLNLLTGQKNRWNKLAGFEGDFSVVPDGRWLIVGLRQNSNTELFALATSSRGGTPKKLADLKSEAGAPSVSPDLKKIMWRAIRRDRADLSDLVVADLTWSLSGPSLKNVKILTSQRYALYLSPIWRAGGREIVFAADQGHRGHFEIFRADLDFDCVEALSGSSGDDIYPTLSQDGNELVWLRREERQLLVASLSDSAPRCSEKQKTVEAEDVKFNGMDGR